MAISKGKGYQRLLAAGVSLINLSDRRVRQPPTDVSVLLPVEIWDVVIDFLKNDLLALRMCMLTCRLWRPRACALLRRVADVRSLADYEELVARLTSNPLLSQGFHTLNIGVCLILDDQRHNSLHDWQDSSSAANDLSEFYAAICELSKRLPNIREIRISSALIFEDWPLGVLRDTFPHATTLTLSGWTFDTRADVIQCVQKHGNVRQLSIGPIKCLTPGHGRQLPLHLPLLEHLDLNFRSKYPIILASMLLAQQANFRILHTLSLTEVYLQSAVMDAIANTLVSVAQTLQNLQLSICGASLSNLTESNIDILSPCINLKSLFISMRESEGSPVSLIEDDQGSNKKYTLITDILANFRPPSLRKLVAIGDFVVEDEFCSTASKVLPSASGIDSAKRELLLVAPRQTLAARRQTMQKQTKKALKEKSWQVKYVSRETFNEVDEWSSTTGSPFTSYLR